MATTSLAVRENSGENLPARYYDEEQSRVLRDMLGKDLTETDLCIVAEFARRTGLDPFTKQFYALKQGGRLVVMSAIDGFRAVAEDSGEYLGQRGPFWCGDDGIWRDVWLSKDPPKAAKVEILRKDFAEPLVAIALWTEYSRQTPTWRQLPSVMLAKCAEAIGLRRAFPRKLGGIYSPEEMDQAKRVEKSVEKISIVPFAGPAKAQARAEIKGLLAELGLEDPKEQVERVRMVLDRMPESAEDYADVIEALVESASKLEVDGVTRAVAE